ncbi:putative outer membrane starch-binding protein [Arcticibacter pallidicorallinus]|uniref:Putative outer membrane starch-binding protein n=1 Tax=Arcticibacter pallidicorallinus TaxID=1259464 RepID=A0A2T0U6V5_9SPHI|nr:RagB/SusD family nutrient uptake outer membrane protein [Arcticibacter pallidicorallinus]PRY53598.1 putative outer membrane starch-binding protein [Arcticibacter pallidicorallinus]
MKNSIKALIFFTIVLQAYSCKKQDILDAKPNTDLNLETTFADSTRTSDFLFGIYSDIALDFSIERHYSISVSLADAADESNHRLGGLNQPNTVLALGALSPANGQGNHPYQNTWQKSYSNIRAVNIFLANVDSSPFSESLKRSSKAEARFLRAWYYHLLVKGFGGVPLLGDRILEATDVFDTPRSSYDDCVKYMVSELEAIEKELVPSQNSQNYGRITSVAAKALKSRILLYAASPLTNGGNIGNSPEQRAVAGYESYSEQRWREAADAAKDALDVADAHGYGLHVRHTIGSGSSIKAAPGYGFAEIYTRRRAIGTDADGKPLKEEFLLPGMRVTGGNKRLESRFLPQSTGTSRTESAPSHNLVKAFGTINGKPTAEDPAYDPAKPYQNRDPRLHYTVIFNGTLWRASSGSSQKPVYTYNGAPTDGINNSAWFTGYYWRKMMDSTVNSNSGSFQRVWPLIRYAEVLMNYAEAKNETGDIAATYEALKRIRERAGIRAGSNGMYGLEPGMSKEKMREVILNERQVEFAFESHRYYDVRRTKTAIENQNVLMTAMKITKSGAADVVKSTDTYQYSEEPIATNGQHVFYERNYWFPIRQTEMDTNPSFVQNPGY